MTFTESVETLSNTYPEMWTRLLSLCDIADPDTRHPEELVVPAAALAAYVRRNECSQIPSEVFETIDEALKNAVAEISIDGALSRSAMDMQLNDSMDLI